MANTTLQDLVPYLMFSVLIFILLIMGYSRRLTGKRKLLLLFHIVPFLGGMVFITAGFLQNDPWGQIIWMFLFLGLNIASWIVHLVCYLTIRKPTSDF